MLGIGSNGIGGRHLRSHDRPCGEHRPIRPRRRSESGTVICKARGVVIHQIRLCIALYHCIAVSLMYHHPSG